MLCALRLEPSLLETLWRNPPPGYNVPDTRQLGFTHPRTTNPMRMRLDDNRMRNYSVKMLELVKMCIQPVPENRPTPALLLADIQTYMAGRDGGMQARPGPLPWNFSQALRMSLADKYKVGKKPYQPARLR
ncbi:hypothetical protein AUEXF2481DRAFT_30874 [Aureobasidium subglaciale EXF-2481]|uniref:Protein kinase domain-containing protein n=1 Tax=Aureobasidium subglaciale (strain EXF-2481) TaxID=1043005 RepID=A0A074YCN6_AURSE|nr:uncharacterized protein AUEXF2481DRAFT_30874 [Aureobasidium subglaciale EXF-2481]KEQ93794.1 hypothetical protein AUEXF2481DRAFT_30874 [Aureobasidium subglaciale EXF-2481]